ncbi:MAG: esterase-like activity of phytase family protein [Actinomycetota bacterium]
MHRSARARRRMRTGAVLAAGALVATLATPSVGAQDIEAAGLAGPSDWQPVPGAENFNRIATLEVGDGEDTSAPEIIAAYDDDTKLIFSDSVAGQVGFADISDPSAPTLLDPVDVAGEPTAVSVLGDFALVGENTSPSFVAPDGNLIILDLTTDPASVVRTINLGGQPDSVAVAPSGDYAAVVIENERDEDLEVGGEEGALPQLPAGELIVVDTSDPDPLNWTTSTVALTGLTGANEPTDPEPEFVDINTDDVAVVSLQENNAIAIVDLATPAVTTSFSAGVVGLPNVDITEDDVIDFEGSIVRERQPDAVSWIGTDYFATANEGDIPQNAGTEGGDDGGSRGFTVFDTSGNVVFESGEALEYLTVATGHFPLGRAENKGNEPEAVEFGTFGDDDYLFVGSERASVIAVYDIDNPLAPELRQVLPAGIGPEGLLALPSRDLFVVANETDDEGFPATVMLYEMSEGEPNYPHLISAPDGSNRWPIPWGAQSGLSAHPTDPNIAYSVSDSFYADSTIFEIDLSTTPPTIVDAIELVDGDGDQISVDLEGVAATINDDTGDLEFWVATEGAVPSYDPVEDGPTPDPSTPNQIHRVAGDGEVTFSDTLPDDRQACWTASADDGTNDDRRNLRFGFEGITVAPDGSIWVAQQREWDGYVGTVGGVDCTQFNDPEGQTNLWRYIPGEATPDAAVWEQYPYSLDDPAAAGGWVGLSEITAYGPGTVLVVERDNQLASNAEVKRIYPVSIPDTPGAVTKGTALDLLPTLQAENGNVLDKVEGAMVTTAGELWISTDNDGVDDHPGESLLINLGRAFEAVDAEVQGYWIITETGAVTGFGDAPALGDQITLPEGAVVVDIEANASGTGAWILDSLGNVYNLGDAAEVGPVSLLGLSAGESLAAIAPRPQGDGAWVATDRGRLIALGNAPVLGGVETVALNAPIVDAVSTASGDGVYLAAPDGGIFAIGDAVFRGSMGGTPLNQPVVSMAVDPDGEGYWLFASDGGVFAFEAPFLGSMGGTPLNGPIFEGVSYGDGYVLVGTDGGVFNFSGEPFEGSLGADPPGDSVVGIAAFAL